MLFEDSYRTIIGKSEGIFKNKGSKFIAVALPAEDETQIKEQLEIIRNQYHDARHHCYAFMLGSDRSVFRFNDDGEPSGTAGRPILGQINAKNLTNILVVVVRYFGGIKLGIRGLIDAYKTATADALDHAAIVKKTIDEVYEVQFGYSDTNQVMRILNEDYVNILDREYSMNCLIKISIRKKMALKVYDKLSKIKDLKIKYLRTD